MKPPVSNCCAKRTQRSRSVDREPVSASLGTRMQTDVGINITQEWFDVHILSPAHWGGSHVAARWILRRLLSVGLGQLLQQRHTGLCQDRVIVNRGHGLLSDAP